MHTSPSCQQIAWSLPQQLAAHCFNRYDLLIHFNFLMWHVAILFKNQNVNKWLYKPKCFYPTVTLWELKWEWGLIFFCFLCNSGGREGGGFKKIPRQHSPPYWQQCSIQPAVARGGDLRDKPEQPQSGTQRQQEAFQYEEAEFHSYTAAHTSCWLIMYT